MSRKNTASKFQDTGSVIFNNQISRIKSIIQKWVSKTADISKLKMLKRQKKRRIYTDLASNSSRRDCSSGVQSTERPGLCRKAACVGPTTEFSGTERPLVVAPFPLPVPSWPLLLPAGGFALAAIKLYSGNPIYRQIRKYCKLESKLDIAESVAYKEFGIGERRARKRGI